MDIISQERRSKMNGITKSKRLLQIIGQMIGLILLLAIISKGGITAFMGVQMAEYVKLVISFGVGLISMSGSIFGIYLPGRRDQLFRDTQLESVKYIAVLGGFQLMMLFITGATSGIGALGEGISPYMKNVILLTFGMFAFMMPFTYVKNLFAQLKNVQHRDPRDIMRQFYR